MNNASRKYEEEQGRASVRVQLIQHPELKQLDRRSVEELRILHREYCIQLRAQGSKTTKPVPIAYCVPRELREVVAMEIGIHFEILSECAILEYLDNLCERNDTKIQMDQRVIFKGVKMRAPQNPCDIGKVLSDFMTKINERKNRYGLNNRLLEQGETELRKQSFPAIIDGIWPQPAIVFLEKRWKESGKKWSLAELVKEIRETVNSFGPYELMRNPTTKEIDQPRDDSRKRKHESKKSEKSKSRYASQAFKRDRPEATSGKDLRCYRCGISGHIRPKCTLLDTDPRVMEQKNKMIKKNLKRLKQLTVPESEKGNQESSSDLESSASDQ